MTEAERYFAQDGGARDAGEGTWLTWETQEPLEAVPGLRFQPVVGDALMANFVSFDPHSEAPLHWHAEEQISFVLEGELEFEVAGETRLLKRGDAVVIPPNVPHAARTHAGPCLEVDVFHPPRQGVLDLIAAQSRAP